jgi:hypothetical protein
MSSNPISDNPLPAAFVEAWRADVASAAELRRGYARFLRGQRATRRVPLVARWIAAGLVLGLGLAQAAVSGPWRWLAPSPEPQVVPQPALPALPAPALPARSLGGGHSGPAPAAVPAPAAIAESSRAAAPRVIGGGPALARSASSPSSVELVQRQWQRAARALRVDDFDDANHALLEIERSSVGGEREAARLARAQLLASHGHATEALGLARDLALSAASPLVRSKARALTDKLSPSGQQDRSVSPSEVTKQP